MIGNEDSFTECKRMKTRFCNKRPRLNAKARSELAAAEPFGECASLDPAPSTVKLKRILVPIDFSDASIKALKYAVPFAEHFGATICLVNVMEQVSFAKDMQNMPLAMPDKELAKIAHKHLISLARRVIKPLMPVVPHTRIGKPFEEIVTLARTQNIDLIIIATQGRTGLKHALLGSTAERVVRHAPCPVLVVRKAEHEFV